MSRRVAEHLVATGYDELPPEAVARAKTRLLDAVGNIVAGQRARGNDAFATLVTGWGGTPEATVFLRDARIPAHNAAMVNALMMRSYDFESVGAEAAGERAKAAHIGGTTIPVALAVGERQAATGRDVLAALILGDDVASRLAVASGFHTASGGDNTGTVNALGAVAISGKLQGFGVDEFSNGMGIALNQVSGTVANLFDLADSFKLPQANSARNGIFSADLAKAGFTGPIDPIAGRFGFFDLYSPAPDAEKLVSGLGAEYNADMIIKPWSSCRAAHPSLDAAVRLADLHDLDPAAVAAVRVHVNPVTKAGFTGQDFVPDRNPEVAGMFSIRYNVAVGLVHRELRPEHLQPDVMGSAPVQALLERIDIVDSLPRTEYQTAEVEVDFADGRTVRVRTDAPRGDIYRAPLTEAEVREKFDRNMAFGGGLDAALAADVADLIADFDGVADVRQLTALLAQRRAG
ncbi:MmgE/PrpD family protein [Microbacterium sp.]|uniref:MmgE/PrpD family protein n=1 Tax=Microbacterium sp. TaxID=51671 RepID=UPI003A8B87CF